MEHLVISSKALGSVIRRHRTAKKLTQTEAGAPFKLNQLTVSNIEQGVPGTRLETIFRMLAALDLEMVIRPKTAVDTSSKTKKEQW